MQPHLDAVHKHFDASNDRFEKFKLVKSRLDDAQKKEMDRLESEGHILAVFEQVLDYCAYYGREPCIKASARSEVFVVEEVGLAQRHKGIEKMLNGQQRHAIQEACFKNGLPEVVAMVEHNKEFIDEL